MVTNTNRALIFPFHPPPPPTSSPLSIQERRSDVIGHLISLAVDFQETETGMQNLTREVEQSVQDYQRFIYRKVKNEGVDTVDTRG